MKAKMHIIHEQKGVLTKQQMEFVPRVGDEIRFAGEKYYKVTMVVWVLDEPECPLQRVNIGVIDVEMNHD